MGTRASTIGNKKEKKETRGIRASNKVTENVLEMGEIRGTQESQ